MVDRLKKDQLVLNESPNRIAGPEYVIYRERGFDFQVGVNLSRPKQEDAEGWTEHTLYLTPGDHEIEWEARNNNKDGQWTFFSVTDLKIAPVNSSYGDWAAQQWIAADEVANASAKLGPWHDPKADPDQDGFSNAYEFAYQTDPRSGMSQPPSATFGIYENEPAVFWPSQPDGAPSVIWHPGISEDLESWERAPEFIRNVMVEDHSISQSVEPVLQKAFFRREADVTVPAGE